MKKTVAAAAILLGALAFHPAAHAAESIQMTLNDKSIQGDSAPIYTQGRVLVPLRIVSEALGAKVEWDPAARTATVQKEQISISMKSGQQVGVVREQVGDGVSQATINLGTPVKLVHNRVYVPLRFVSEQLGYQVTWANHTVSIQSPAEK